MISFLFSKLLITVCLNVMSSTIPNLLSSSLIKSPTLNGLKITINTPAIKFDIAACAAKPRIAARIPAPEKISVAFALKTGTVKIITNIATIPAKKVTEFIKNFRLVVL